MPEHLFAKMNKKKLCSGCGKESEESTCSDCGSEVKCSDCDQGTCACPPEAVSDPEPSSDPTPSDLEA